jgi:hypothetical protein
MKKPSKNHYFLAHWDKDKESWVKTSPRKFKSPKEAGVSAKNLTDSGVQVPHIRTLHSSFEENLNSFDPPKED